MKLLLLCPCFSLNSNVIQLLTSGKAFTQSSSTRPTRREGTNPIPSPILCPRHCGATHPAGDHRQAPGCWSRGAPRNGQAPPGFPSPLPRRFQAENYFPLVSPAALSAPRLLSANNAAHPALRSLCPLARARFSNPRLFGNPHRLHSGTERHRVKEG